MKTKRLLALLLSVTLLCSVLVFTPAGPAAVAEEAGTVRLLPADDTYIDSQDENANSAFGGSTTLEVGYNSANPMPIDTGYAGNANRGEVGRTRDMLLKFDLGDIDPSLVSSAVLKLYVANATTMIENIGSNGATSVNLAFFEIDNSWSGKTATWNNAPEAKADKLAAISHSLTDNNSKVGSAIVTDLTSYIRQTGKTEFSFRVKISGAGAVLYSSETGSANVRPTLEISYDSQLESAKYGRDALVEDTYAEDSDAERENTHGSAEDIVIAVDKTAGGNGGAMSTRNSFIKVKLPITDGSVHYDSAKIVLRAMSIANAAQEISLIPISADWDGGKLTWANQPAISGSAAATVTVPNNESVPLDFYAFDIADYVNAHPSEDGVYAFALKGNTAVSHFYSLEAQNETCRPYVEYLYRENASVTVNYINGSNEKIAEPDKLTLPVGNRFTPEIQRQIKKYVYSEAKTAAKNALPYVVQPGDNQIYIVYDDKSVEEIQKIEVKTIQFIAPKLPETVEIYFNDGSTETYPVSWTSIPEENYSEAGEFTVIGTVQGIVTDAIAATVKVLGINVELTTISTAPGVAPMLPASVTVNVEDGSTSQMNVIWNEIEPEAYAQLGSFVAHGNLDPGGMPVGLTVLVEDGDVDERIALDDAFTMMSEPTTAHNGVDIRVSGSDATTQRKIFLRFKGGDFAENVWDRTRGGDENTEPGEWINGIVNASVRLFFQSIGNNFTATYSIYGISPDGWDENSITWNNSEKLIENAKLISTKQIVQRNFAGESWVDLDVTDYVRANRNAEYLAFYIEADHCAAVITSKEGAVDDREGQAPRLRTTNYIENAPVTLHYVEGKAGKDIAKPLELLGKLDKPYTYEGSVPDMIFYPEPDRDENGNITGKIDPKTIYYYDFRIAPNPPKEEDIDPDLQHKGLKVSGNDIYARYTQRMITEIEPVVYSGSEAAFPSWSGVRPELPDSVSAVLDNGARVTKNVTWRWDEVTEFTIDAAGPIKAIIYGDVEHAPENVRAKAEIAISPAAYGDPQTPVENLFSLLPGTTYRLTFTVGDTSAPDYAGDIIYSDGMNEEYAYNLMGEMSKEAFFEYLSTKNTGDFVELFFTVPELSDDYEGPGQMLALPDTLSYFRDAELYPVLGSGNRLVIHYMYGSEELMARWEYLLPGSEFFLSADYAYIRDGAYVITGISDAGKSALDKLTGSVKMNGDMKEIYLSCAPVAGFTVSSSVETLLDSDGTPYTRSRAAIYNGSEDDVKVEVIVATFSEDGRLEGVTREFVELAANTAEARVVEKDLPVPDSRKTVIYVWDGVDKLVPITRRIDSTNPLGITPRPVTDDLILIPALERSITATDQQSGNEAVHILDRNLSTRWSGQPSGEVGSPDEKPVEAIIDLGGLYSVHTIGMAFYRGDVRSTGFTISASDGDKNGDYSVIITKKWSSGNTANIEYYPVEGGPVFARYIKIEGFGWMGDEITDQGIQHSSDHWFSLTAFEAYGTPADESAPTGCETFDGDSLASVDWGSAALSEMTYTDYTPQIGKDLYADIAPTPDGVGFSEGNTALHLYDNVDRTDNGGGAGSVGAFHQIALPSDNYRISFKWYVPNTIAGKDYNAQWAGVTLSSGRIQGGADTSHPAALQLRLSPSGKNKMAFNVMRSITYNEGSQTALLGSGTAFKANCVWDVMLDVDAASNSVVVTVSDGEKTESAFVRYGLYNDERTMSQTWSNSFVNYIMFNTGAGGKCEMYIDDLAVTPLKKSGQNEGKILKSYDFNEDSIYGKEIRQDNGNGLSSALIQEDNQAPYNPSYGSKLYVDIKNSPVTDASLHLYDNVGREQNGGTNGSGGVLAYVDLGKLSTVNETKISFDMYASTEPAPGEWAGFALASGHNSGGADQINPLALQLRFSPQSDGMQLNRNTSIQYNKGSNNAFIGTGSNRLSYGQNWHFDITVNPTLGNITVQATDGRTVSSNTAAIPTAGNDDFKADWSKKPIDTLIFNTGAGGSTELFIDNIEVRDMGEAKPYIAAVNGIIRLQDAYDIDNKGQSYFVVHANAVGSALGVESGANPYYTRMVERKGLYDPDGVSFELIGQPGCYVVVEGSSNNIVVRRYSDTEDFRKRATFYKVKRIGSKGDYSYELCREKGRYLRVNGTFVETKSNPGGGEALASSFYLRDESKQYVSDSFNGSSLSGQWYKGYPWYSNYHNHSAVHRNENVVVSGGQVTLKATPVASNDWIKNSSGATGYSDSINGGKWKKYCAYTGVISVNSKVYNKGSYIEGSFKQPNSPVGYWTAFWLNGRDSWPPETDMFEYLSSKGTNTWYTATHGGQENAGWMYNGSVGNMRTQWNTFTIDWGYNYIDMYVNGNLYFSRRGTSDVDKQKNMQLILNTGIGAWETEPNSSTVWNTGLQCQWIRSYQYY
ncbi:MAG: DNRLRE domain-containing protein [Oscillospiraceae bacterium]|nr:DNRLRE domain-containing protein [Oscillospiraceae bacterium]